MRLITWKIWRAFPELDRFSDEQCRKFIRAADARVGWGVLRAIVCIVFAIFAFFVSAMLTGGLLAAIFRDSKGASVGLVGTILMVALTASSVLTLLIRDIMLRQLLRRLIDKRGACERCGYSLLGLPVDDNLNARCPECGERTTIDASMVELTDRVVIEAES